MPTKVEYPWHKEYFEIREAISALCAQFTPTYWDEHEANAEFPEEFFKAFAEGGWLGTTVPEELGGSGLPLAAMAAVFEEVAASGGALDACSSVHLPTLVLPILLHVATPEQRERFLPKIVTGEIYTTFGVTEPNAGTDTTRIATVAERNGHEYVIRGQKIWQSGALRGDRVILVTRTAKRDPERPAKGITLFMVDLKSSGITIRPIHKISRNAVPSCEMWLDDVRVPAEDLIGEEGEGFYHLLAGLNGERLLIAAECLGMGRWAVEHSADYANERVVFGKQIGENQAVAHPIADAYLHLLAASHVVAAGLAAFDAGAPESEIGTLSNAAKYLCSEAGFKATDHAMQVHGGFAFSREYHVGRYWIESRLPRIAPVSNQVILNYFSRKLGLPRN